MAKKMLIDATHAEETRVVVVDGNKVEDFDFESESKRQLAGNIYLAKVTRVEPSLQAAFVDYGGNRHGFLAFSEIHPDYYQIPVADRQALMEEEAALAAAEAEDEPKPKPRRRSRKSSKAAAAADTDAKVSAEPAGMETVDPTGDTDDAGAPGEGLSPMETVAETPVEEPQDTATEDTAEAEAPVAEAPEADAPAAEAVDAAPADSVTDKAPTEEATGAETPAPAEDADDGAAVAEADEAETDDDDQKRSAADRDSDIEAIADDDTQEDIRPARKPRPRRYKIQEVIKVRQVMLVQVVKEERGNKGAALTTYLSLAGRYCVLMPNTARGGGISRKITNAADRQKLKAIAGEIDVPKGAGLIIRTAGAKRTKTEIKRDYEYLQRLWEQIRELTLKSIAPTKIYAEGDLIKRSIRDLYNRDIDEVLVEGERGYRIAKDFMKMIMPSHAKNVQHYTDPMPLFARYQVETYLGGMFNPVVQLKSGGYIVIGVTEALVAIDVNSGRATKEGSIEETATKTNLEAAEEVARQLRLRDLAGLIVIDFIDMDERKNNTAVEKRLKDKLKTDRARIQVGRISGFGLLEMSRQRLRPGMIEATTQPCSACHGTGLIRSDDSMALQVLRQIEEEGTRRRSREVLARCPVGIANYLMNQKREHVATIEARYGMAVRIEGDPHLVAPDFTLEKFKTATRPVVEPDPVVSASAALMEAVDEAVEADDEEAVTEPETVETPEGEDDKPRKKRRRRRRRSKNRDGENADAEAEANGEAETKGDSAGESETGDQPVEQADAEPKPDPEAEETAEGAEKPKRRRSRRRKPAKSEEAEPTAETESTSEGEAVAAEPAAEAEVPAADPAEPTEADAAPEPAAEEAPKKRRRTRRKASDVIAETAPAETAEPAPAEAEAAAEVPAEPAPEATPAEAEPVKDEPAAEAPAAEPELAESASAEAPAPEPAQETADENRPRRRGWWALGR